MVEINTTYEGHKEWMIDAVQEIITEEGETLEDVIKFMNAHLSHFGYNYLHFNPDEIQQRGNKYYVVLKKHPSYPVSQKTK